MPRGRRRTKRAVSAAPKKPGRPKTKAIRPSKGGLALALDEANAHRPPHVPQGATLLVSWVNLPGQNTQATAHWAVNKAWKDTVKKDFAACLDFQGHPGLLSNPAVHIALHVSRAGDDNNLLVRAKYAIDLLQLHRVDVNGKRSQGLLDLIVDDSLFNAGNRTAEERFVASRDTGKVNRAGQALREAPYKAMIWVWDRGC